MDAKVREAIARQVEQLTDLIEHYYPDFESVEVTVKLPERRRLWAVQEPGWSEPAITDRFLE